MDARYDVLICGGGLAGLTLARQLHREFPDLSVAVAEKTRRPIPEATHKVGESSVELGSQYFESLGLKDYLLENHLIKFGLRFFPGGGQKPVEQRVEIGPVNHPIVNSYQIDRGRFETDMRQMITDDGVTLLEGVSVKDVVLGSGEEDHSAVLESDEGRQGVTARWLVDATGRAGLLRGKLKLKRGGGHEASSGWYRVKGRVDINNLSSPGAHRFRSVPESEHRWLSTTHLMGEGYWVWIIPLSSGNTSIGVVCHEHVHGFDEIRTLERTQAFLQKHEPVLAKHLESFEVMDFGCIKNFCHTISRAWHPDRWALVGEAGAFPDPLYSPGSDYIAIANTFTAEMIRADRAGDDLLPRSQELNIQYRALIGGTIDLYKNAAEVYGNGRVMATKVYWDDHVYWSYPCQYFLQGIYKLRGDALTPFGEVGARFVELSHRMQHMLQFWARNYRETPDDRAEDGAILAVPTFPSILVDGHVALEKKMSVEETLAYMKKQLALAEGLFSELTLRIISELGAENTERMFAELEAHGWELNVPEGRTEAEALAGRARKKALPLLAQDAERTLGAPHAVWPVPEAATWIRGLSEMSAPEPEVA